MVSCWRKPVILARQQVAVREMPRQRPVAVARGAEHREARPVRQVEHAADHRADAAFLGRVVGAGGAVKARAVGDGDGFVAELRRAPDQGFRLARAKQEREGGMRVQLCELRFHR